MSAKSVLKEIIIVLLLCLAIILILGILLYEYVPIAKTIPNEVSYTTPENVKQELLSSSDVDDSQIIMTYEVNSDDLSNYRRIQDYVPGKANPFSSYETQEDDEEESESPDGNSTNDNSSTTDNGTENDDSSSNSGGHFFQNTGTK